MEFSGMDQDQREREGQCLICGEGTKGGFENYSKLEGAEDNNLLNGDLWSIFVLRKLLKYPEKKVVKLIQELAQVSLGNWFELCAVCRSNVEDAMKVYQLVVKLTRDLENYERLVTERIKMTAKQQGNWKASTEEDRILQRIRSHFGNVGNARFVAEEALTQAISVKTSAASGMEFEEEGEYPEVDLAIEEQYDSLDPLYLPSPASSISDTTETKSRHEPTNQFQCSFCPETFSYQKDHNAHVKNVHNFSIVKETCRYQMDGTYLCPKCPTSLKSYSGYLHHHSLHSRTGIKPCPLCNFPAANAKILKKHKTMEHSTKSRQFHPNNKGHRITCKICHCKKLYTNMEYYKRHLKAHQICKFSCSKCKFPFATQQALKLHQRRKRCFQKDNSVNATSGSLEPKTEMSPEQSQEHTTPISCPICLTRRQFGTKEKLNAHLSHHKTRKLSCPQCRFPCKDQTHLENHLKRQKCQPVTEYPCPFCNFITNRKYKLDLHTSQLHQQEIRQVPSLNLKCDHCGDRSKDYANHEALKQHIQRYHKLKDKKTEETALVADKKAEQVQVPCTLCNRKFRNENSLQVHLHRHRINPYPCPHCNYPCASESKLQGHMEKSLCNPVYEYACNLCKFKSKTKAALDKHLKEKHVKEFKGKRKEKQCDKCEFTTNSSYALINHRNSVSLRN